VGRHAQAAQNVKLSLVRVLCARPPVLVAVVSGVYPPVGLRVLPAASALQARLTPARSGNATTEEDSRVRESPLRSSLIQMESICSSGDYDSTFAVRGRIGALKLCLA
jgi:hypothetical protein